MQDPVAAWMRQGLSDSACSCKQQNKTKSVGPVEQWLVWRFQIKPKVRVQTPAADQQLIPPPDHVKASFRLFGHLCLTGYLTIKSAMS